MPQQIGHPKPPRGLKRLFLRAPIWCYRLELGWIPGKRFLLLTHTGRKSGLEALLVLHLRHVQQARRRYRMDTK